MSAENSKHFRPWIVVVVVGVLALGGGLAWYWWQGQTQNSASLKASGTLEVDEIAISPEVGGRITQLQVKEGDRVAKGQTLVQLDESLLELQMKQADPATRRQLQLQKDKLTLQALVDGWVVTVPFQEGEVVTPGRTVLTLADLQELKLTVYIRQDRIGHIKVGQEAMIAVDSFPGVEFRGQVIHISSQIEFTPKNIQTTEDRVTTVFAVKLRLPNPDLKLKPGMFADAYFALVS